MAFVGNLLWFIFGGIIMGFLWLLAGLLCCITIVGIPMGVACFRIASFAFFPFGKDLVPAEMVGEKRIVGTGLANFLWCILLGLWLAIGNALLGVFFFCTIIGIPFGFAYFKLAKASFAPLGQRIVSSDLAKAARTRAASSDLDNRLNKK